jgi:hypothetical protein
MDKNGTRTQTICIYFKQPVPGVGAYDPVKPDKLNPCSSAFKSGVARNLNQRFLEDQEDLPGPMSYNHMHGFDLAPEQFEMGSAAFRKPHSKKVVAVNMYNPHEDASKKNTNGPGPGSYNVTKQLPPTKEVEGEDADYEPPT